VSQLLAELDGMSGRGGEGVFVVGATNRPDLLDEALLRPGRFDKMLYLGISDTHDKQKNILQALTRKFDLADNVSLERIASKCPFTYTGADFYAMSSDAMLNAMTRTAGVVDEKLKAYNETIRKPQGRRDVSTRWWFQNVATKEDIAVQVTEADFDKALRELVPSVSAEELQHYLRVRANFEGGKKQGPPSQPKAQLPQVNGLSIANGPSPTPVANGEKTLQATEKKKNKGKGPMPEY
jgi:peroxin-6